MDRIGQKKLIDEDFISKKIIELIHSNANSGEIIVVEDNYEK